LLAGVLLSGCGLPGGASGPSAVLPREGRSGLRLAGTVDGRQVAVNDGLPRLRVGDCDPMDGADADLCVISRTIDGRMFVLAVENPDVLNSAATLAIADPGCPTPVACDEVDDLVIVDVQLDTGQRRRAVGGTLELALVEPVLRYTGGLTLRLPGGGGGLAGQFDLVPRPDD
jgi:hypothetical protein